MTDPLGQSQIIPYIQGLCPYGYSFTILSFEKKEKLAKYENQIRTLLEASQIEWKYLSFTRKPPVLSKMYDLLRLKRASRRLQREKQFDMTHCRGYLGADIGLALKKKYGVKFLFDMRGFWADEKKDAGAWNMKSPIFRRVYKYYKAKEKQYLQYADGVISLTKAGLDEMKKWPGFNAQTPVEIIPCCADMNHFSLVSTVSKQQNL